MYGGIDEAGRGPVLGPLVVAGVAVDDLAMLDGLGIKDSKRLSPAQRSRLARLIRDLPGVRVALRHASPDELDRQRKDRSLNDIEVAMFRDVAAELGPTHLWLDAADVDAERFGRAVGEGLSAAVVSQHKADDHHTVVAAASIIAKVERDAAMAELARRLERASGFAIGSGYPSDPTTTRFLQAFVAENGCLPEGARASWATSRRLMAALQTPSLDSFDATSA